MTSIEASPKHAAGPRFGARFTLLLIALLWPAQLLSVIGLLAGNAQAQITVHFQTTQIAWFTLTTALVGTFVTPFVVKAANMYGKKRVMVVITVLGLAGDLIAALATSYSALLVGRGVAGFYTPIAMLVYAISRDVFPPRLVGPASGLIGGGVGLVALGGPFLSGWLVDHHGFRGVLWFLVAATALSLVLLLAFVPESPVREERTRIDWLGGLLLGGGLAAIVYGVGKGAEWGWTGGSTLAFIGGGIVALIAFLVVEGRVPHPMFDLSLLARRQVWTVVLATSLIGGTVFSAGTINQLLGLMPRIPGVSDGLGFTATRLAVIGIPGSVLIVAVAVTAGALARRIDARVLLAAGALCAAAGLGLMALFHHSVPQLVLSGIPFGIGMGTVAALAPIMVIQAVSPSEQSLGNGMQGMAQGIVTTVVTQLIFVVLAQNGRVLQGTQFYLDAGYTNAFWLAAGFTVAGLLAVLLIPKVRRLDEAEVGQAAT
ncbi:Major Facilitator Superfamily protein [Thermomonospora echinospora]|uniref:Major Facilitator Superfamily protein n=1 Tax=Thermomonospora echinospora TaxID=1992 RepID=A0A1H6E617_9ACTN|nr:MFS transporter [Thermomonospora echinospora]SEG92711.1 Major Facilitator Superfamily protein [Thermomonospora echinospora]